MPDDKFQKLAGAAMWAVFDGWTRDQFLVAAGWAWDDVEGAKPGPDGPLGRFGPVSRGPTSDTPRRGRTAMSGAHHPTEVVPVAGGFQAVCFCGWRSMVSPQQLPAYEAANGHMDDPDGTW